MADLPIEKCGTTLNASGMLLSDGGKVPDGTTVTCAVSWSGPFKVTLAPEADHG